jgi:hypothetical protein
MLGGCDSWVGEDGYRVDVEATAKYELGKVGEWQSWPEFVEAPAPLHDERGRPEDISPEMWADLSEADRETGRGIAAVADMPAPSQEEYCAGCAHVGACNVELEEGEVCSDRIEAPADDSFELVPAVEAPAPFRPRAPWSPDRDRGEGPAQGILPMVDAGPLFSKGGK